MDRMQRRFDWLSVMVLIALCYLFWWRLLTPAAINQQSLVEGDFSGQFVAFAHYQAERLGAGEIPLWNPYNLGGHPFLADTQAAVFYPFRLLTVATVNLSGGPTPGRMYDALQREMALHSLIASLLMYALLRRLTLGKVYSSAAGLVGGMIFAYGGYMTGYPPLQLAVMEAGVWSPLALLGILEATRLARARYLWFFVSGAALALSLLAGHPQTSLFLIYIALAWLAWRTYTMHRPALVFALGAGIFLAIGGGVAAVQLLPGWEYLQLTTRDGLSFAAKGNGFPIYDVLQVVFPGLFSQWSPMYFGILGLMLAGYVIWRHPGQAGFWAILAIAALGLSFGAQSVIYDIFYNFVPGFSLFRGQERSAYGMAVAGAVLAGLGLSSFLEDTWDDELKRSYKIAFGGVIAPALGIGFSVFSDWVNQTSSSPDRLRLIAFALTFAVLSALTLISVDNYRRLFLRGAVVVGLLGIELFSFSRLASPNLEARPALDRLSPSPLVIALQDIARTDTPLRVEGIPENYGTLYDLPAVNGTSPLRLASVEGLLNLPNGPRTWEVMAAGYVITPNRALPVPSTVQAEDGDLKLHRLDNPRPFARFVPKVWVEADPAAARGILAEPSFDSQHTVILETLPEGIGTPQSASVTITAFAPESITLEAETDTNAVLELALVYYPGWEATLDGKPASLLRADTAMTALVVPAGRHTVALRFNPPTFWAGLTLSGVALVVLAVGLVLFGLGAWRREPNVTKGTA